MNPYMNSSMNPNYGQPGGMNQFGMSGQYGMLPYGNQMPPQQQGMGVMPPQPQPMMGGMPLQPMM